MEHGIVSKVILGRNYGFIKHDITRTEYFFHRDDFNGHWSDLEADFAHTAVGVSFEIVESAKGPRAAKITRDDYPSI